MSASALAQAVRSAAPAKSAPHWALAGLVYAGAYVALVSALGDRAHARLLVGNVALLIPPIAPILVMFSRRGHWHGRQAVFWAAIAAWPMLWLIGQVGWSADEVFRAMPLPWFRWHIILQLCGSALPLIALVAWPHRGAQRESAVTAAVDVAVLVFLAGFLYWSLIIAPGMDPPHSAGALRALAIIGPTVRFAALTGLLLAMVKAEGTEWASVYQRLALGMILAFVVLVGLSLATVKGDYQTGSPTDVGWMLPFWFAAWAIATAPASGIEAARPISVSPMGRSSPLLLFAAILAIPVVGYGARYLVPAAEPIERMREIGTAATLVCGVALLMVRIVVERRSVESALQRVRLLATACEQAGELIAILRKNRIQYANDAFCQATGYSRNELLSLTPMTLVAPESKDHIPPLRDEIRKRHVVRATTVMARKDGSTFQVAWSAAPIVDGAGRVTDIVSVIRDVTEDVRLREQLVRSERMSAIGELVSGVAHEINNPLQSVIGTVELLLAESHETRVREDLQRAKFEAGRAGRIIRNLLAFVRRSPGVRMLTELNEIVQSVVLAREYELIESQIEVRKTYGVDLPLVLANRDEIQQVVSNLVMNAQHAMLHAHGRGTLSVRTFAIGDHAVLELQDDGPGVSPEIAPRMFEPFVTTNAVGAGTGLGLSLAFGIVNAHGGTLELMPCDHGACFRLTLPGAGYPGPVQAH
jgi:PAS domain S-box-containing protein